MVQQSEGEMDENVDIRTQPCEEGDSRFICEARLLEKKWALAGGFLDGMENQNNRQALAVLLENQRLMNEIATAADSQQDKFIPLVRHVYRKFKVWDWVSVQPLLGPTGLVYRGRRGISDTMVARTRSFKRRVAADFGVEDVSWAIVEEIENEVLTDLWENCSTVATVNLASYEQDDRAHFLKKAVKAICKTIEEKTSNKPNWAVIGNTRYNGIVFDDLKTFHHPGVTGVLVGYKGDHYDSGYVYSPYVPFTFTPGSLGDDRKGLISRYGKKLYDSGSNCYGRVTVIEKEEQ